MLPVMMTPRCQMLHLAPDSDPASTAAPADDEQDLFGREEALRMDTHGLPVF